MFIRTILLLVLTSEALCSSAQMLHAHNDYEQNIPFWEAYANAFESIEADVYLQNDTLWVTHQQETITRGRTLESLYLDPLSTVMQLNLGKAGPLQLLVDIKSEPYPTLSKIVEVTEKYPFIFQHRDRPVTLVISGNRPAPEDYANYPSYIQFDHQSLAISPDVPMEKVALVSLSFRNFSVWNGKGRMTDEDRQKVREAIAKAHTIAKPIRFWATPDSKTAWAALYELGVDFINTDHPYEAATYVRSLRQHTYAPQSVSEVYLPTFDSDGKHQKVKNIILIIGDGMGLAQVSAGMYGNHNQLTLTGLKHIGFSKTRSADDFTTDSAAGATAMSTGVKTKNRFIGVSGDRQPLTNLPEYLTPLGFSTGLVTTDHMTGATPAAFYAHQSERDLTGAIARDLAASPLTLFIGAGKNDFKDAGTWKALETSGFTLARDLEEVSSSKAKRMGYFASDDGLPYKTNGRGDYLPAAAEASLAFLERSHRPFFLMIEGAFIDSGGHNNRTDVIVEEVIDLDQVVSKALQFADREGETLVIITADHETGGLSLPHGNAEANQVEGQFHSDDHSGIMVPVFAYGPHADEFTGVYENTEIHDKITELVRKYHR